MKNRDSTLLPSQDFNDPIAAKCDWRPLKSGGANFQTHKLRETSINTIRFEASASSWLFSLVFIFVGSGMSLHFLFFANKIEILATFFGFFFLATGIWLFRTVCRPAVLDKDTGYFWLGWKKPQFLLGQNDDKTSCLLADIYAVQLLSEHCKDSSKSAPYHSYEINLILQNGQRRHVVDHGKKSHIVQDGQTLANFLDIPLWNIIK